MWKTVKLGDVCDFQNGFAFKSSLFKENGKPILRISNIQNEKIDTRKTVYFDAKDYDTDFSRYEVKPDDLLIAMSGATTGKIGFNKTDTTYYLNQRVGNLKPKPTLDKVFLYYLLSTKVQENLSISKGAAQPNLSSEQIKNISFSLPPLAEQQRIVAKLDANFAEIDETIKITDDKASNYTDLSSSIMREILNDDLYRWETKSLSHLSENLDAKRIPITKSKRAIGNVPYYGASGIVDYVEEYLFDDDLLLISEDGANLLMRTYPIAFSVSGKCWVNNHAHVLKFENPKLQDWVELYLNATNLSPYISGMAQPKLNQKKLNEIPIPCPDGEMLERLLNKVASAKKYVEKTLLVEAKKTTELKKLKSAILAQELQSEAA
ncbi:restriction endonuclease subunit S [Amylibacter sp.]|nr:restriction endonuclease subunit S [Amylibacter sp.]